jgi:hypothetical protein
MKSTWWVAAIACGMMFLGLSATSASAQATRTWVSGVGDDANPCSRTAPCKTFPGAIAKTAAGGEINCLDPGGFGAVTITKSIAIICDYTEGGVLVSGTNAIVVNALSTDIIYLSGLDIEGLNTGLVGVNVIQAAAVHINNSKIRGFTTNGVKVATAGATELYMVNDIVADNPGGAVLFAPLAGGSGLVTLRSDSLVNSSAFGFKADVSALTTGTVNSSIQDSTISGNNSGGVVAITPAGSAKSLIQVLGSTISGNQQGLLANGNGTANAQIFVSSTIVTGNATGFSQQNSGVITSYKNNSVDGNTALGTFVQATPQ